MTSTFTDHSSSSSSRTSLNPQRTQSLKTFLALDTTVTIIPTFSYKDPLDFLTTQESLGPFQAGIETSVPLWMAVHLRKRNLCRLKCPTWMQVENLKRILRYDREPNNMSLSKELPFRYAEISSAILQACGAGRSAVYAAGGLSGNEEIPQAEVVRVLLEDIGMVRMEKIRKSIHNISANHMVTSLDRPMKALNVTGMGAMEMAAIQPFLERAFEDHFKLSQTAGTVPTGRRNDGMVRRNPTRSVSSARRGIPHRQQQQQEQESQEQLHEHGESQLHTAQQPSHDSSHDPNVSVEDDMNELQNMGDGDGDDGLEEPTADSDSPPPMQSSIRRYRS